MLEVALQKRFSGFTLAVAFTMDKELAVLFGPSGAGKSLTLQTIAGTVAPDAGYILLDGQPLYDRSKRHHLPPQQRRVGYVPQHYALFPHLSVAENIAFGLGHVPRQVRTQRVAELLELFSMQGFERRLPRQLSGGQQQRVALAVQPRLLLLDEPFAALDGGLRETMRQELLQVHTRWGITVLLVTHDLADVFALGQRILVYDRGQVIQQGTRDEVFFRPQNLRVAEFVHTRNILPAVVERVESEILWLRWQGHAIATPPQPLEPGTPVYLCIRPTQVLIVPPERLASHRRENLLWGNIVRETRHVETHTLSLQLEHSTAVNSLEITVPSSMYYRLGLDTNRRILVELDRQAVHIIPRHRDARDHSSSLCSISHTPVAAEEP
jgi:ABC-type sulfate/molybdate transport systems ATPase subunit